MSVKDAELVRPGDWIKVGLDDDVAQVSKVEHNRNGVVITAPPRPPVPMQGDAKVTVTTQPPTAKGKWDDDSSTWLVTVYVPEGGKVSVGIEPDRRDGEDN